MTMTATNNANEHKDTAAHERREFRKVIVRGGIPYYAGIRASDRGAAGWNWRATAGMIAGALAFVFSIMTWINASTTDKLAPVSNAIDALDKRITTQLSEIDKRYAARMDTTDKRLDRLEVRVDKIDDRLRKVDARLEAMDAKADARFEAIDGKIGRILESVKRR